MPSSRKPRRCSTSPVFASSVPRSSSSSSHHTAIATSAALFHVWRLENPSSCSPIRFAASSATCPTRRRVASSKPPATSDEHTAPLQSPNHLVCHLLLEKNIHN